MILDVVMYMYSLEWNIFVVEVFTLVVKVTSQRSHQSLGNSVLARISESKGPVDMKCGMVCLTMSR